MEKIFSRLERFIDRAARQTRANTQNQGRMMLISIGSRHFFRMFLPESPVT
ncbi:hypothetical protein [Streptomyces sp. NPDC102437]|uniref:hypothetical protein n=1 Tax=Streptomyces sp. NPDC102437 TaxID=3366175 RepID=UPI00380DCE99